MRGMLSWNPGVRSTLKFAVRWTRSNPGGFQGKFSFPAPVEPEAHFTWKTKGISAGGGGAQGLVFCVHDEQASVVYWYLPSHNIHKHLPGLLLVMLFPALCKTRLDAIGFHAATLHWAYARLFHGISPVWNWTVVVLARPYRVSAFGTLHNKHSVACCLWHSSSRVMSPNIARATKVTLQHH